MARLCLVVVVLRFIASRKSLLQRGFCPMSGVNASPVHVLEENLDVLQKSVGIRGKSLSCKDSMHVTCTQAATQETPVKSLQCGHCTLLFKSRVYLFEHLNKVHGFDVDVALRDAGLKSSGTNETRTDSDGNSSGMGCGLDDSNEQEKECEINVIENQISSENPETSIHLTDQHKNNDEASIAKEISSVLSVLPTSKTKCIISSSKDLKTYKRPLQVITKYFTVSPGSNGKPPINLADSPVLFGSTKETLILQESPTDYSPHSSGVFKLTAKPTIDLSGRSCNNHFLLHDSFLVSDLSSQKPKEEFKRTNNESSNCPPAKKAKSDEEKTKGKRDTANTVKQPSNCTDFSFEFSEDEEEKKGNLVNGEMVNRQVYFCKHCDYSDVRMRNISAHYQSNHPYVRYNAVYIRDPSDQSATFRCLECPVEFLSVADLRRHYAENHPEAPNIFMMQSCEFRLVYKCFVCPFTTTGLKVMEGHYKQSHPSHKVDSPLMYCKYSATKYQEAPSLLLTCEKALSPERPQDPERSCTPCKEVTNEPSPKPPTSKGADVALYYCTKCEFSHKSVVVMHVHYQKNHPDEAVTIDKIKQSAHVKSHTTSQMLTDRSSNSVTVEEPTPQKNTSDSSEKETRNKADAVSQDRMSLSLRNPKDKPETSKTHSESPKTREIKFSEDRSKGTNFPTEHSGTTTGTDNLSSSSPNLLFYCQICSYSSTNVRSVVGHHNAKHTTNTPTDFEKVLRYTAKVQKNKLQSEAKAKLSDSKPKQVEVCSKKELKHEENVAADASVTTTFNPYACAENLFYCQKCNYGNTTVFGVLSHQSKVHLNIKSSRGSIIDYTALIRDEIEKSKSQAKELDFATHLPLPLMNEGDEDMYFCHFCNYRQNSVKQVLRHYLKKHRGFVVGGEQVRLYTSMVLKQTGTKNKKLDSVSASSSTGASQTQRTLQCQRCSYRTQYVCLLKRHLQKVHKLSHSVTEVLRVCFKQGTLQTGYHCDLCVFSHKEAAVVYEHYQEQHPEHRLSLEYVTTRLYVGPKTCISKKKKPQRKRSDSEGDDTDGSIPSQDEIKTYSCRACSFKSSSMSVITRHYRAVHPWAVKEDGSVLDVISGKKQSVIRQVEDHSETPVTFETYQVPLEFDNAQDSSHEATEKFKCHFCSAEFPTQRSLNIHCGMKHQEVVMENLDERQEEPDQLQTRLHVFKCPHCTYVNTNYQGVLTHCQMKHPALESRADSLYVDEARSHNCVKRNGPDLRLSGYMCETCPHIYATLEKLNKHCETDHNSTVTNAPILAGTKKNQYKNHTIQGSKVSKASFLSKKLRCQHCSYTCSTKLGIARHVHFHHNNSPISHPRDSLFRCSLCSRSYFRKKRLGNHYISKHGKESFLKYYVPIYKQGHEKPAPIVPDHPSTQQPKNPPEASQSNTTAEESKILVYKCPNCLYVNSSYHGTLTHCQMRHPDLIARADDLQTIKILSTNMVSCKVGKACNERGYLCAKCPQIHASLKKLRIHCMRDHNQAQAAAFEHSFETETEQPDHDSVLEADSTEIALSPELDTPETCQTSPPLVKNKETLYKCHICNYMGTRRRYLYCHYKKTHKFDAIATCKLLERYNKDRRSQAVKLPESEESADVKCKMCPNLKFDSSQLLIDHYSTFHRSDCISDFTVLSQASKRTTGLYKCDHCMKQMNGIKKLCYHLDRHREKKMAEVVKTKASSVIETSPEAKTTELCRENEMPMLQTVEELTQWNVTPVATLNLPPSPLSPHSKPTDLEGKSREHTCKQCERTFMSLRGLRSHERSHAALASIKKLNNLSTSALKHNVKKYLLYKAGTIRPFLCSVCSFRTTVMDLWKCHFMKKHQDVIMNLAETDNIDEESFQQTDEAQNSPEELNNYSELDEEPEIAERSLYLEPPDVQRQLNYYNLMAQASAASKANVQASKLPGSSLLHCEMCNFNTGHLSSMRRHYLNRHGKKILRCKDCNFFTGLRKTLELHIETGHSTFQSEATHQKDLCCPFCLYQTKNKNNMIDHIVLHREERVVPIEVCRPKLSRYLQGIVFRCHKCTFTSGTAENLCLHMMRHNDIKPYKCRLCYFDCTQLSDLEAHLSDKHQVLRNHELVGQVSLDQLQARVCRIPEEEVEPLSNLERHSDSDDAKIERIDCKEVPLEPQVKDPEENNTRKDTTLQFVEVYQNPGQDGTNGNEESSLLGLQCENTKPNTAVQEKHEQEPQEHTDTAGGQVIENIAEQKTGEESNAAIQHEKYSCPEKGTETNEKQDQPKFQDGEDNSKTFTQQKEEAAEQTSTSHHKRAEQAQAHKLHVKALTQRKLNIDARVEDDILRHILLLDEDGSRIHRKANQDRRVKIKQNIESDVDNTEDIPTSAKTNFRQANNIMAQECFKVDNLLLTHTPRCGPLKISHKEILGVTFTNCKEEQVKNETNCEEVKDPYGEMPVLENEYLKEEMQTHSCDEDQNVRLELKEDKKDEMIAEYDEDHQEGGGITEAENPHVPKGAATDGVTVEEKRFTCELCGRNLTNSSELERHVVRHRI